MLVCHGGLIVRQIWLHYNAPGTARGMVKAWCQAWLPAAWTRNLSSSSFTSQECAGAQRTNELKGDISKLEVKDDW